MNKKSISINAINMTALIFICSALILIFFPVWVNISTQLNTRANEFTFYIKLFNLITVFKHVLKLDGTVVMERDTEKVYGDLKNAPKLKKFAFLLKAIRLRSFLYVMLFGDVKDFTDGMKYLAVTKVLFSMIDTVTFVNDKDIAFVSQITFRQQTSVIIESIISVSIADIIFVSIKKLGEILWKSLMKTKSSR